MTRGKLLVALSVAALTIGASPAWAQRGSAERADPDSRASGPERTGSAVDRGSSSGSSSSSGGSSGGSSSVGSGGDSGSSSGAWSAPSAASNPSSPEYVSIPVRPNRAEREQGRERSGNGNGERRPSGSGGGSSTRAVPRGSGGEGGSTASTGRSASSPADDSDAPSRRAVPTYARPRGGREATGVAVDRTTAPFRNGGGSTFYYPGYSNYYSRYYFPGYAFGLGYFYDPFMYDPYYYGGAYGAGYGGGYGGGYYGGGYQGGYGASSYGRGPTGSLRLKIRPRDAQVYVDGYFVGVVDSFDGVFQRLGIDAGGHRIEIKATGFEPISFDVLVTPGETVTYKGELRRNP